MTVQAKDDVACALVGREGVTGGLWSFLLPALFHALTQSSAHPAKGLTVSILGFAGCRVSVTA